MLCVRLHICTCLHAYVVLCTYVLSVQIHVCVKAPIYSRPTCGPGSRQPLAVEARPETKCPASSSPSQMTLLTDLTVSASLSPGRPPPPPTITTTHSSLSWLTGLGYTTATVTSHLLGCVYVCAAHPSRRIQTSIFQLFSTCSSEKIMDSNIPKQTYWAFPPHSSSAITELAVQPFSPFTVILLPSLQCSLRFLTNCLFSHLNTPTPPPCSAYPCKLLLSGIGRRKGAGRGGEKTAFLFVAQCNYVG